MGLPGSTEAKLVMRAKRRSKVCHKMAATTPNLRRRCARACGRLARTRPHMHQQGARAAAHMEVAEL